MKSSVADENDAQIGGSTRTDVVDVLAPLRRYVRARTVQPADAEDVIQETVTRLLELEHPLAAESALAYALVTARHLLADAARDADRHRRHAHLLVDLREPVRPDEALVDDEERRAVRDALAGVPRLQRQRLLAHVLEDEPIAVMAVEAGRSDGSIAAQLARTRAKLRLDYVLAMRGETLPTHRCRPVLVSLSAGEARRQEALRAGEHLLTCLVCADLAQPLLRRRRALAALLPWLGLGPLLALLQRLLTRAPVQAGSAVTALVVAGGAAAALSAGSPPPTLPLSPPPALPTVTPSTPGPGWLTRVDTGQPLGAKASGLSTSIGRAVSGRALRVVSVPADEGFWIADQPGPAAGRVWVQLRTSDNDESRDRIRAGDTVSFTGRLVAHGPGFAHNMGVDASENARLLTREGAHISVAAVDLKLGAA